VSSIFKEVQGPLVIVCSSHRLHSALRLVHPRDGQTGKCQQSIRSLLLACVPNNSLPSLPLLLNKSNPHTFQDPVSECDYCIHSPLSPISHQDANAAVPSGRVSDGCPSCCSIFHSIDSHIARIPICTQVPSSTDVDITRLVTLFYIL